MKKNLKKVVLVLALLLPGVIKAQEFNVTAKADFVSDYIWRGAYQNSGFSVQPTLGLSYGNLSLSAWGSQSLTKTDGAQEFDINLSYTIGGLGITVTDYWWNGITMPYGDYKHDHHFEGTLAYNFGENFPLTLSWSTCLREETITKTVIVLIPLISMLLIILLARQKLRSLLPLVSLPGKECMMLMVLLLQILL